MIMITIQWYKDEDVSHAAFRFCSTNMLHASREVKNVANHLRSSLASPDAAPPAPPGHFCARPFHRDSFPNP